MGLNLSTRPEDLIAAILEGTTFELKTNITSLENAGIEIECMHAIGGGAQSNLWLQLKADITQIPIIRLNDTESGCLGAAIQAGVACGLYSSRYDAIKNLVKLGQQFEPDKKRGNKYKESFEIYQELYHTVRPISEALSKTS
jgi:xylulokinase